MTDTSTEDGVEATFAFVELAGFTAMTEAHGDLKAFCAGHRDVNWRIERVLGVGQGLLECCDAILERSC